MRFFTKNKLNALVKAFLLSGVALAGANEAVAQCAVGDAPIVGVPRYATGAATLYPDSAAFVAVYYKPSSGDATLQPSFVYAPLATKAQIGSTWGVAYNGITGNFYAAAVLKRHTDVGPQGLGAIYIINNDATDNATVPPTYLTVPNVCPEPGPTRNLTDGTNNNTSYNWYTVTKSYTKYRKYLFTPAESPPNGVFLPGEFVVSPDGTQVCNFAPANLNVPTGPDYGCEAYDPARYAVAAGQPAVAMRDTAELVASLDPTWLRPDNNTTVFADVAKIGLGGIDISTDVSKLYAINLKNCTTMQPELVTMDPITGAVGATTAITSATTGITCTNGTLRPWAVKQATAGPNIGNVYIGAMCDAGMGGTAADLRGYVLQYTPGTGFTSILNFPLNYNRVADIFNPTGGGVLPADPVNWEPWQDVPGATVAGSYDYNPQPIISDLEFTTDGKLLVSLMDRHGLQSGAGGTAAFTADPAGNNTNSERGRPAGDVLRIDLTGDLSSINLDPNDITDNHISLGRTRFREGNSYLGGLAYLPGEVEVLASTVDATQGDANGVGAVDYNKAIANGTEIAILKDNQDVLKGTGNAGSGANSLAAKGMGIGDVEIGCAFVPQFLYSLGNLVWKDANNDGLFNMGEEPIPGIKMYLFADENNDGMVDTDASGNKIILGTTTTDANGKYLFSGIPEGKYIVGSSFPVDGTSSTGAGQEAAPDSDANANDNGITSTTVMDGGSLVNIVISGVVTLSGTSEPLGANEGGDTDTQNTTIPDTHTNLTVDFGFNITSLPVSIASMSAAERDGKVNVRWATASEKNNDRFEVERASSPLAKPELVATVRGAGNSNALRQYAAVDNSPMNGTSYYRIVQYDNDGKSAASTWMQININEFSTRVFPNPAKDFVAVQVRGKAGAETTVTLSDASGRIVRQESTRMDGNGAKEIRIDLNSVEKGIYFVKVVSGNNSADHKIVLTK